MARETTMPLFFDIHSIGIDMTPEQAGAIHRVDDEPLPGAQCLRHWVTASGGRMFCLVEADDAGLAARIHSMITGVETEECHPVSEHA